MEKEHKAKDIHCGAECKKMKMPSGMHKMPNGKMMSDKDMPKRSIKNNY